jgi:uncharacterized protein YegP (UPF0339 family)
MTIELFSRKRLVGRPRWFFRVVARNGQIVAQSEAYSRRIDAMQTAHSLKEELSFARIVDA